MVEEKWDSLEGQFIKEGGPGSGNWGHGGRPGEVGGSSSAASTQVDPPHVILANVNAILSDNTIAYDAPETFIDARQVSGVEDPSIRNRLAFADKYRDAAIEWGSHLDSNGTELLLKQGTADKVEYYPWEYNKFKNQYELDLHNHPDCDRPFSPADLKFAVNMNPEIMSVATKNYMFTMTRPQGGWPKKMARDAVKQLSFKPVSREAWAVWNKGFAQAYRLAPSRRVKEEIFDKACRVNTARAMKYFGVPYKQEKL